MNKQISSKELVRRCARGGIIAAVYAVLTVVLQPLSFGAVQFRISEAMCVLPVFFPEAVLGLFIGCIISNFFSPNVVILDVVFGSLATLIAAAITRKIKIKWLVPLPCVISNALIVGPVIAYSMTSGIGTSEFAIACLYNMLSVGFGELVVCYAAGIPLMLFFERLVKKYPELLC